jgi:hypothetical protein
VRKLLTVFFIFICRATFAQDEARLHNTIADLHQQGVDTFIVFNNYTNGEELPPIAQQNCIVDPNEIFFLYWIYKGSTSVIRIDNCYAYQPIVNLQSAFVKGFTENLKKVNKELIKPLTYLQPGEGRKKKWNRVNVYVDHSAYYSIQYITPTDTIRKTYDLFDLQAVYDDSLANENYKYNSNTLTVKLANLAETETRGFSFMLKEKP